MSTPQNTVFSLLHQPVFGALAYDVLGEERMRNVMHWCLHGPYPRREVSYDFVFLIFSIYIRYEAAASP
jgi:hypothetical protein